MDVAILIYMRAYSIFITFVFAAASLFADGGNLEKMFAERAKTCATVKYIIELEENRNEMTVFGTVVNKDGLIILPPSSIPYYSRPSNLKDFRVYFEGGDSDGYKADFLGMDVPWGAYFIKLRDGLPQGLRPIADFKPAEVSVGQEIWGILLAADMDNTPLFYKSYVSAKNLSHKGEIMSERPVAGVGLPAFDLDGNFAGWGQSAAIDSYTLYLKNGEGGRVELWDDMLTRMFIKPENFKKISQRIPSKPVGDKIGWLGITDVQAVKRDAAKFLGIENIGAVVIGRVFEDSPAQKAGLKRGDMIVSFDGKELPRMKADGYTLAAFIFKMENLKPGEKYKMEVLRDGEKKAVEFTAADYPREFRESDYVYFKRLGFSIREFIINDAMARNMQRPIIDAPVVQFVKPNSPASSAQPNGLGRSEIIREINSVPIKSYKQAVEILSKINSDNSVKEMVILSEDYKETKLLRIKLD